MGTLYIVGTPIGNLEDITLRAVRVLGQVDLIAAEDTRVSRKLLSHLDIHVPLTSYHQHNWQARLPSLLDALESGDVALVTDAGNFSAWVSRYFRFLEPHTHFGPISGAMGYGVPAAIGVAFADAGRASGRLASALATTASSSALADVAPVVLDRTLDEADYRGLVDVLGRLVGADGPLRVEVGDGPGGVVDRLREERDHIVNRLEQTMERENRIWSGVRGFGDE
jgi:hypothetical protein